MTLLNAASATLWVGWFAGDVDASIKTRAHDFGAHVPPPPWAGVHCRPHEGKTQRLGAFYRHVRSLELLQAPTAS